MGLNRSIFFLFIDFTVKTHIRHSTDSSQDQAPLTYGPVVTVSPNQPHHIVLTDIQY